MRFFTGSIEGRLFAGVDFKLDESCRPHDYLGRLEAVTNVDGSRLRKDTRIQRQGGSVSEITEIVSLVRLNMQDSPERVIGYLGFRGVIQDNYPVDQIGEISRQDFARKFGTEAVAEVFELVAA